MPLNFEAFLCEMFLVLVTCRATYGMIHTVEHHYHGFYSQQCTHIASSAAEAESAAVATGFTAA